MEDQMIKDSARAIIIGGGISGKLIAASISPYFDRVEVLEKDAKAKENSVRPGVSQGHHIHALLHAGDQMLEMIFPGFKDDMEKKGSIKIDSLNDFYWFHHGAWKIRSKSEFSTFLQSRPFLEEYIESRINIIKNIAYSYETKVLAYIGSDDKRKVIGVKILQDGERKTLSADLIIDASGAASFSKSWMEKQGQKVYEEKVEIGLCYATRQFQLPDKERDFKIKLTYPNPPFEKIGGALSKVEGGKYIATLIGYINSIKPEEVQSEEGFIKYSKKLPLPDIYQELSAGKSLSETRVFNIPHIVWRRFDRIHMPEGLIIAGDSFCRIDPFFGQGMSIAALQANEIGKNFSKGNRSTSGLQKKLAKIVKPVWSMVICEDFRYSEVKGKKPFGLAIQQWYVKKLFKISATNLSIYKDFVKVMNLTSPITTLFKPSTIKEIFKSK
ncbi:glutamate synthase subunit beta [Neobacillus terrae]|uniref:glutamate synthase subunit beta n=1 Tax=Neobacillus terrae TaxID=3034837 RepID=UPI00140793CF|nr:glutamate synthase subunit beta [Neobacillus terrae]NHM32544.1 glutamate synthase subunit beta [Neobacillus terrae]